VDVAFGWDATSDVVEDYMYERLVQRTAFDPQIREWMNEVNPAALFNITEKLLEAIKRGMWKARQETEAELTQIYLEAEGEVEQSTDTQGNGENK
jgi:cobaltochelatase CobN